MMRWGTLTITGSSYGNRYILREPVRTEMHPWVKEKTAEQWAVRESRWAAHWEAQLPVSPPDGPRRDLNGGKQMDESTERAPGHSQQGKLSYQYCLGKYGKRQKGERPDDTEYSLPATPHPGATAGAGGAGWSGPSTAHWGFCFLLSASFFFAWRASLKVVGIKCDNERALIPVPAS